jgi:TPR repeat protein
LSASLFFLLLGGFESQVVLPAYADTDKAIHAFNQQDYKTAFREFLSSAQAGNAEAQVAVGSMLMTKMNPPGSGTYSDAEAWLLRAAKQSNIRAMAWLGKFYSSNARNSGTQAFRGNTSNNPSQLSDNKISPMSVFPRRGINPSMSNGALSSFFGGSGRIPQQAGSANAPWVATPAASPHFSSTFNGPNSVVNHNSTLRTTASLEQQEFRELNFQKARYWFQQAAENGNRYAMEQLAILMDAGLGGPQESKEAARWRTRMRHKRDKNFTSKSNNYPIEP